MGLLQLRSPRRGARWFGMYVYLDFKGFEDAIDELDFDFKIVFVLQAEYNATLEEIESVYAAAHNVTLQLNALTPGSGTYSVRTCVFLVPHRSAVF